MKKLIKLITLGIVVLVICYAASFVHQCRQMQDVFNSFVVIENPSSGKKCSIINETLQRNYEYLHFFDSPRSIWIDVGDHFVYSAFWKNRDNAKYAVGLGIGPPSVQNYECSVWFEFENIISSVQGKFVSKSVQGSSTINIYKFHCLIEEETKGNPYVLVFHHGKGEMKKTSHIPIFHKPYLSNDLANKTAVCVRPDSVGIGKADIIEFMSFHLLIGVSDLILYGNEIHYSIVHKVRQLIGASNFLRSLSLLDWNFPLDDSALALKFIELDCDYRTYGLVKAFAVLEWDQYIVPNAFKPILEIVNLENNYFPVTINVLSQICCLESNNDKRSETSWPVILKKTYCTSYPFDTYFKVHSWNFIEDKSIAAKDYSSSISIKTYRNCYGLKNIKTKYDHVPFKFLSGLLSSELLRLWNTGSMF